MDRWLVFVHSSAGAESILCVFTTLETRRRTTTIYGNQRLAYRSVGSRDGCVLDGCRVMVMRSEKTTNLVLPSIEGCPNSFAIGEERKSQVFAKPRFLDAVDAGAFRFMQDRRICSECHNALTRRRTTSSSEGGRFSLQPQCERTPRAYPPVLRPFLSVEKQRPENVSGFADIVGTSRLFCFVAVLFLKQTSIASHERQG